jgi:anti-sigma B factor antagonist
MSLSLKTLQSDETLLKIAFTGKLDAINLPNVEMKFHALINNQNSPVILDFSEVSFLASLGIRMLLTAYKDVARQGHSLKIENAPDEIKKVFLTAGLSEFLM